MSSTPTNRSEELQREQYHKNDSSNNYDGVFLPTDDLSYCTGDHKCTKKFYCTLCNIRMSRGEWDDHCETSMHRQKIRTLRYEQERVKALIQVGQRCSRVFHLEDRVRTLGLQSWQTDIRSSLFMALVSQKSSEDGVRQYYHCNNSRGYEEDKNASFDSYGQYDDDDDQEQCIDEVFGDISEEVKNGIESRNGRGGCWDDDQNEQDKNRRKDDLFEESILQAIEMKLCHYERFDRLAIIHLAVWKFVCLSSPVIISSPKQQQPTVTFTTNLDDDIAKDTSQNIEVDADATSNNAVVSAGTPVDARVNRRNNSNMTVSYLDILHWQKHGWKVQKQNTRDADAMTIIVKNVAPFVS